MHPLPPLSLFLLLVCARSQAPAWAGPRGDAGRTGRGAFAGPTSESAPPLLWSQTLTPAGPCDSAFSGGTGVVDASGNFFIVESSTCSGDVTYSIVGFAPSGKEHCRGAVDTPLSAPVSSSAGIFFLVEKGGVVYIAITDTAACSTALTAVPSVSPSSSPTLFFSPACKTLGGGCVVVFDGVSTLFAYDELVLSPAWTVDLSQSVPAGALYSADSFAASAATGSIFAASPRDTLVDFSLVEISSAGVPSAFTVGAVLSTSTTPFSVVCDTDGALLISGGGLAAADVLSVAVSVGQAVVAWSWVGADAGEPLWPLAASSDRVWAVTKSFDAYSLDKGTGIPSPWSPIPSNVFASASVVGADGFLYCAQLQTSPTANLNILALNKDDGTALWTLSTPVDTRVALAGGLAIAVSTPGALVVSSSLFILAVGAAPTPTPSSTGAAPFESAALIAGVVVAGFVALCFCKWCARSRAFWGAGGAGDSGEYLDFEEGGGGRWEGGGERGASDTGGYDGSGGGDGRIRFLKKTGARQDAYA